jgi:hypothetical protein
MDQYIEDARVREVMDRYFLDKDETTPENTRRNYAPKQAEWGVSKSTALNIAVPLLMKVTEVVRQTVASYTCSLGPADADLANWQAAAW